MTVRGSHWALLLALVALWGLVLPDDRTGVTAWQPTEIAGLRIATAAVVLLVAMVARGERLPRNPRHWGLLALIGLVGNCLPFVLISWGQQQVESGLAGILAASTPLFVLIMAHYALDDEPLARPQAVAFGVGFAGIVVLLGPDSLAALGGSTERLLSQLAILGAAAGYAAATVIARKLPETSAVVTSAGVMLTAAVFMSPFVGSGRPVRHRRMARSGRAGLPGPVRHGCCFDPVLPPGVEDGRTVHVIAELPGAGLGRRPGRADPRRAPAVVVVAGADSGIWWVDINFEVRNHAMQTDKKTLTVT